MFFAPPTALILMKVGLSPVSRLAAAFAISMFANNKRVAAII